jgi:hypothetical protein
MKKLVPKVQEVSLPACRWSGDGARSISSERFPTGSQAVATVGVAGSSMYAAQLGIPLERVQPAYCPFRAPMLRASSSICAPQPPVLGSGCTQ